MIVTIAMAFVTAITLGVLLQRPPSATALRVSIEPSPPKQPRRHRDPRRPNILLKQQAAKKPPIPTFPGAIGTPVGVCACAAKTAWTSAEMPEFTIDLRKRETGDPDAVRQTLHNWLLDVDGRRFRLAIFTTSWESNQLFDLGTTRQGFITFHFHRDEAGLHIRTGKDGEWINSYMLDPVGKDSLVLSHPKPEGHFEWTPGKHVVRVAFPTTDAPPPGKSEDCLAISNPVEVRMQGGPLSLAPRPRGPVISSRRSAPPERSNPRK